MKVQEGQKCHVACAGTSKSHTELCPSCVTKRVCFGTLNNGVTCKVEKCENGKILNSAICTANNCNNGKITEAILCTTTRLHKWIHNNTRRA